jgi:hypothetical protein
MNSLLAAAGMTTKHLTEFGTEEEKEAIIMLRYALTEAFISMIHGMQGMSENAEN